MALAEVDELDSNILGENVTFLNDCFDSTFVLQNTLPSVKEYVAEIMPEPSFIKSRAINKSNSSFKSCELDQSIHKSRISVQYNETSKVLKNWGLPDEITRKYEEKRITEMFDWQVLCLGNSKVLADHSNLLYSAPTSAGKTLVAEILVIKTVLERQKKVIVILPFVSIVREKMFYLQDILSSSGIRVEGFMGAQSPPGGLQAVHIAICTIEKANSLINRLLDENSISELGAVVVDELHLLGDPHRGYILELLLTKIKYISSRFNIQIQIIGMSATLPNLEELATWLDAELFVTDFRPIPLNEFCLIGNKYYDKLGNLDSNISNLSSTDDNDIILNICLDTIRDGCSVLIFCMTKNRCENLAQNIATSFYKLGCSNKESGMILREQLKSEGILEVLEQLKNSPVGLDQILKHVISFGVAYHHAGLTFDERDIIEGAFKSGALRVLVATSTLSSGVNLPARKVIIRSPMFQRQSINILTYKQMIGRAGRMGKDTKGESILICTEAERKVGFQLMMGTLDPVKSCLDTEDKYMRSMLEIIASENVCSRTELELYSRCTLLYTQKLMSDNLLLDGTLKELINFELIRTQNDGVDDSYVATSLGKACLSSSMAPNDGLSLFCELQKARQCLVLETDLHLIYLVTPYSVSNQWRDIDWLHLLTLWESLTKAMKRVGELVGVQESFIIRGLRGTRNLMCPKKLNIHKRFYTALALQDIVNEVPLSEVAMKFQCARGFLQSLQQASGTFAGMVTAFCRQLGWKNMEILISQFQDRLHFGIHSELIELMKLPSLNSTRARALFNAGIESISNIASADINVIENIFHKAVPFQSKKKRDDDDDDDLDVKKRLNIKNIWITGCCGMTPREAANVLILEARKYLKLEIGVNEIKWDNEVISKLTPVDDVQNSSITMNVKKDSNCELTQNKDSDEKPSERGLNNLSDAHNSLNDYIESSKQESEKVTKSELTRKDESLNISTYTQNYSASKHIIEIGPKKNEVENYDNIPRTQIKDEELWDSLSFSEQSLSKNDTETIKHNIPFRGKNNKISPCMIVKEEILWDSLPITETAIQNISKAQSSGKLFSPNLSFGEDETKPNDITNTKKDASKSSYTSSKDISLFSSDGENSFLDESFTVKSKGDAKVSNDETKYLNTNTIIEAFKSSAFENAEQDDMKLIYEEDNDIFEELPITLKAVDNNEVVNTQNDGKINIKSSFISPLKRPVDANSRAFCQSSVKKKKKSELVSPSKYIDTFLLLSKCDISTNVTMKFDNYTLNCVQKSKDTEILKIEQIFDLMNLASIIIEVEYTNSEENKLIGSDILKNCLNGNSHSKKQSGAKHEQLIKSMTMCFSQNLCFYLDLTSTGEDTKSMLSKWLDKKALTLKMLHLKENYTHLKQYFKKDIFARCSDIALTEWLIDSDTKLSNAFDLTLKYCKIDFRNVDLKVNDQRRRYNDLAPVEDLCLRAWCLLKVAEQQELVLLKQYNSNSTLYELENIETHVLKILANSERRGITVDKKLASQLLIDVKKSQEVLQMKAFKMCGYHFNFNSSKSVAKVLGLYKGRKVSTKKSVLTAHSSPLASVVIFWRKLNSILTKTLFPLTEQACIYSGGNRITPSYTMFTCTGRISMHEPNLQNVPRTFSVPLKYLSSNDSECSEDVMEFNCREVFRAGEGHVLVSADYCQLEMRILTHYSADPVLMKIMRSYVDVFKSVASSWSGVPEEQVDDDLRQKAKQLCYGIIYGMGIKTLAQHLDVTETEASLFMDTFYKTYPSIKIFANNVLEECRKNGFVETLKKRRRYLPDINSHIAVKRSAAERQAINTMIQGSAADIAKAAMCAIDTKSNCGLEKPFLVLQMHDELIYEVPEQNKHSFIKTIKEVMEGSISLKVPLPVKVKSGYTWGSLKEVKM